jgi:predicted HAD superfamily Cof-like phosphohydrolase
MSDLRNALNEINKELQLLSEDAKDAGEVLLAALASLAEGHAPQSEWVADIAEMHHKFGVNEVITNLDKDKLLSFIDFRLKFLQEELDEAKNAHARLTSLQTSEILAASRTASATEAGDDIVDAMVDLCVVAIGTLDALEVDADEAWSRVMDANMKKTPGIKPSRPNPLGLPDLIKPAGWVAPQHADNIGLLEKLAS